MTTAVESDPYILPLPGPDTPVVLPHRALPLHAHLNARYAAADWPLAPLNENPSSSNFTIHWCNCPTGLQDELRLIAWTLINGELRPSFLRERGTRLRARISATNINETVRRWMHLAVWLQDQGIDSFEDCASEVLHDYGQYLLPRYGSRSVADDTLGSLTRLWAYDQLSARPLGIGRPPWDEFGADDYLPAATHGVGGENDAEPLAEETMGPLLIWAMRMVDDFADDILAAWAESRRLIDIAHTSRATPASAAALESYLDALRTAQAPLPVITGHGRGGLARFYIGGLTGASRAQLNRVAIREGLVEAAALRPGPCPLDTPVTGRIGGMPWRETFDMGETASLMRHLGTAAFIVLSYLTGMRPGEAAGLRSGCCPDPEPGKDGKVGRHLIRGHEFKTATDEEGNYLSTGQEREVPWVAITPVVNAIRVLERMVPEGALLFDHKAHDLSAVREHTGALRLGTLRNRIEDFVVWANAEATAHGRVNEVIPPDPQGKIGTERFRRSLAWHIARRPNGLVALAIQYGHLRTTFVSEGYAARSRDGIHELIDVETVRAVADTVAELHDDLEAGAGVSGPAARRAIRAAATAPRFEGTAITPTTARRLIANEDAMIFDNPQAFVLCHYKRAQALCHRDGIKDTPSLDHCVPGCGNIARTDRHAAQLRDRADFLDKRAAFAPQPAGDRLRANAGKLRGVADAHDRSKISLTEASA
ncbi:integrase [Streptomyces sp. NPDC057521]|uniref:integrase n=1 Tax=Streptomyces sp. NPDC057521 TaxID=3346156 RepID=UPI0036A3142C